MSLKGKTLFITGASRGIGLAIALRAARDGANIAVAAKTDTPHPKLPGTIHSAAAGDREGRRQGAAAGGRRARRGEREEGARRDRGDTSAASTSWSTMRARSSSRQSQQTDMRRFDLMHQINTRGTFMVSKHAIPHLAEGREPAHPDALAAARHEGEMVRGAHRLHDGEVRHEPRGARACGRAARQGRGECAVAAHHDRDLGGEEPARRRRADAHVAHAGHPGRRGLCDLQQAEDASPAIS